MSSRRKRIIVWSAVFVGSAVLALAYWVLFLFSQLDAVTAQRTLGRPARYFSDISALKEGSPLSMGSFELRLRERGYSKSKGEIPSEGQYMISDGSVQVFLRPFYSPEGTAVAGLYDVSFASGTIARIEQYPQGKRQGELILEPVPLGDTRMGGPENRPWARLDDIPSYLKTAVLECEDRRFYSHPGVDVFGIFRAVWVNTAKGGVYQGGSTLTQQLVRNAFLTQKRTLYRKITEAFLALLVEFRYDKNRIFELYLNQIYLGQYGLHVVYGVEDAAQSYFGRRVSELTLSECALIVGMIPSPNRSNPHLNPRQALERRNHVLKLLLRNSRVSQREAAAAFAEKISFTPLTYKGIGSYYIDWVRQALESEYGAAALEMKGLSIYTALDPEIEKAAESALAGSPVEGALVALDANTGYVKALVGGTDFGRAPFNRAVLAKRSPGSAFKPVIYAAGLEYGLFKPDSVVEDTPLKLKLNGSEWEPQNFDGRFLGKLTYKDALVFSRNIPAVRVLDAVGMARVAELARRFGIESGMNIVPSLALGTSEVTPLEMTAAYAPFANGGDAVKPVFIRWVVDEKGKVLKENKPARTRVISEKTAAEITSMLREAIDRGTGQNVRKSGFAGPAAGKTGTSDYFHDAWFIGFTPELLCGVWLGNDMPSSLGNSASVVAIPVWAEFMKNVPAGRPDAVFGKQRQGGIKGFFLRLFGE